MKRCPHCAEEIQDAAVVCKHCDRNLAAPIGGGRIRNRDEAPARSHAPRLRVLVGIAVVAVVLLLANQLNRPAGGGVQQQGAPGAKPPLVINIALASDIDVDPGSIQRFSWSVPQDRTHCHVTGRIEVTSGGNRDIQIFLSTEDDYTNWANGHEARAFLSTDKTTVVNLDTDLNHGGNMVLALSNKFSVFTGKRVQLRDVKALCS